jgi:hypothetical protein
MLSFFPINYPRPVQLSKAGDSKQPKKTAGMAFAFTPAPYFARIQPAHDIFANRFWEGFT